MSDNIKRLNYDLMLYLIRQECLPQLLNNDRYHYQRLRIEERVQEKMTYSEDDFKYYNGGLVARRTDKTLWIINGQHQAEAAFRLGRRVPMWSFESPGWEYEQLVFNYLQTLEEAHGKSPQ